MALYPEVKWFGFDRVDGTIMFFNYVNSLCFAEAIVLDYGAGRGEYFHDDECDYRRNLRILRGKVAKVIGVDIDKAIYANKAVDETYLISPDGRIPLNDASLDIILADWVFEHIADPASIVAEFKRVLKPGGYICARTPNKFGYIALGARVIPESFHNFVLKIVQPERKEDDVFPKVYMMNTRYDLSKVFATEEFDLLTFCSDAAPSYAGNSAILLHLFKLIHIFMPEPLKTIRLVFARKR
ncbi:class I SAM-dependent methyltransferase [Rhodoblastus sp.]|uniref:class I SAM-dependent methyltransferase n=1 Tax=Rhodoblastus sp. TaxID=1962975 RepID=UPI003F97957C